MKEILDLFIKRFNSIRDMGYVKAVNNYNSGIGLTFEKLLGKKVDDFPLPDFENTIEIKTKLAFSKRPIHLFKLTPEGNTFFETKRLLSSYGYYRRNCMEYKVFNGTVVANSIEKIGMSYYFSLEVSYKEEKVKLIVYDKNKVKIDDTVYWTFGNLENALYRKLKYLALIQVWSTQKNGIRYYKYYRYDIYKLSNFYTFLSLIEKGIISVTFSIDIFKEEKRYGQIHDHGTTFDIDKDKIEMLFNKV